MAHLMRDWIAPVAKDELFNAFESLKSEYTPGQVLQKYPYECSPDNVTVHLAKGHRVQLIDFNGKYEYPFEVTLSDATTKIRATFTPSCTAEFGSDQEFVQRTRGAVLGIMGYYLTYKPQSPPSERLMLRITNFKALGCEGNPTFGRPIDIEDQESLWDTLAKLDNLLSGSEAHNPYEADEELEILSQAGDQADRQSSPVTNMATQRSGFATQVPARKAESKVLSAGGITKASAFSKGADFMALLNVSKSKDTTSGSAPKGGIPSRTTVNAQAVPILQPVSGSRRAEMASKFDSKVNSQSSAASSNLKDFALPPKESDLPFPCHSTSDNDSEKENSQGSLNKAKASAPVENPEEIKPVIEAEEPEALKSYASEIPEVNPFEGMKRVPRSFVRIPENQKALLESKEAWWKRETGSRSAYANVPLEVLRYLNTHADQVNSGQKSSDVIETVESAGAGNSDNADEENEEEERDDDDDYADDRESKEVHSEEHSHLPNERLENSISDEESIRSWSETHYSSSKPEESEVAPGSFLRAIIESAHDNGPRMASDIPSAQKSSPPSPLVSNNAIPPKLKPKFDYNFPSSSPGDGEELEIAVPHAVGDEVDGNDAETIKEESKASQDPPSTAVTHLPVVQVEQTPDHNVGNGKQTDSIHCTRDFEGGNKANEDISSDPIIPATCLDPSSQECPPISKRGHPAVSDKTGRASSSSGEQLYTLQEDDSAPDNHNVIEEEDDIAQKQLFTELESSQGKISGQTASVSPTNQNLPCGTPSSRPASYYEDKMSFDVSPSHRSPQPPTSSSFHNAFSEMRPENEKPQQVESSLIIADSPKRASEDPQPEVRRFKNRPFILSLAATAAVSQEDGIVRDTAAMRKAQRHEFHARHSSPFEEPPVVQIAQSQLKSPNSNQASPARSSTDAVSPQLSNDFIRSSIPERTEKLDQEQTLEALPTKSHNARERSPLREGSQPDKASQIVVSIGSPRLSLMESLELMDDLDMAQTAAEISDFEALRRSSKLDRKESNSPSETNVEVVSMSSDSEDEDSPDVDELADDDDSADKEALGKKHRHISEAELVHTQGLLEERDHSPRPTAFDKFKCIYPSYSGSEKKFVWALIYIEWLVETKGEDFLRPSLWDDLVRTLAAEYLDYMREARHSGGKIRTGFEHFNRIDKPPIFQQRFLTLDTLQNCISTFDPQKVKEIRLMFKKSTSSSKEPPRPESSNGTSVISSKNSQTQTKEKNVVASSVIQTTEHSDTAAALDARSLKGTERTSTKRPFFETPSQLQAAKKSRTSNTTMEQDVDLGVLRSSKSRSSLPPAQAISPQPSQSPAPLCRERTTISALVSASRANAKDTKPRDRQRATPSKSFNGSSASPILGEREPTSHSFSAKGIRTGSITLSPARTSLFKELSTPVSQTVVQQCNLSTSHAGEVEGWLDGTEVDDSKEPAGAIAAPRLHQKDSIKRKRDSGLELLNMSTPGSKASSASSTKRAKATSQAEAKRIASTPLVSTSLGSASRTSAGITGTEVRRKMSFKDFLKRRASGLTSKSSMLDLKSSTRRTKSTEGTAGQHMEPATQAWGRF